MGSEFLTYLRLGLHHITDVRGYDHILFIAALTVPYRLSDWKRLLWLVTAFTLGHSVTLALATMDLIRLSPSIVEPAIGATILLSGLAAFASIGRDDRAVRPGWQGGRYLMAAGFGLIHGLGFSNYLRSLLGEGEGLALPLFAFNVGLEVGQLLIVSAILAIGVGVERMLRVERRYWVGAVSVVVAVLGGSILVERLR
jgi:hypothetical protein